MSLIMEAIKKAQQMRMEENQKISWSRRGLGEETPLKENRRKWLIFSVLLLAGGLSIFFFLGNPFSFFASLSYSLKERQVPKENFLSQTGPAEKKVLEAKAKKEESPPAPSQARTKEMERPLLPLTLVAVQEPSRPREILPEKERPPEKQREEEVAKFTAPELKKVEEEPAPEIKVKKLTEETQLSQDAVKNFNAGTRFSRQRNFAQAVQCYKQAIQIDPQFLEAYNNLALVYQEIGHLDQARETLQRAAQINPNYEKAWNNLGLILLLQNRYKEAREVLEKSLSLNPHNVESHLNLGVLYRKEGELNKALEVYMKALQLSPLRGEIHYNLALIWEEMNNLPEAIRHFRSFLHLSAKDYPGLAAQVSQHLHRLGKEQKSP